MIEDDRYKTPDDVAYILVKNIKQQKEKVTKHRIKKLDLCKLIGYDDYIPIDYIKELETEMRHRNYIFTRINHEYYSIVSEIELMTWVLLEKLGY